MRFKYLFFLFLLTSFSSSFAQKWTKSATNTNYSETVARPKLVVGMVIDQMRWDYLYRFYNRYSKGGFKRLINEGFSVENTFIPYLPTQTACGHSSIYTGSVPALNGIIANSWYDQTLGRDMYCTEDKDEKTVGSTSNAGQMSPKNLKVNTITDELRLATNFQGKVISISLKDRGSILPGGHSANAAYWHDGLTGNWITSTHYMSNLPNWVTDYNAQKISDKFFNQNWNTLYPINTYINSDSDNVTYEGKFNGETTSSFPHLTKQYVGKNYEMIKSLPYGNTMTVDFAKLAVQNENLGKDAITDFLAISCSATDYVGHQFGPNSIELEDTYLRLDKDIEELFNYLDKTVGKGNYLFFLSADHGVAHAPEFLNKNNIPAERYTTRAIVKGIDSLLQQKFQLNKAIINIANDQVIFNHKVIDNSTVDFTAVKSTVINYLKKQRGVSNAVDLNNLQNTTLPDILKTRLENGYNPKLSGDIQIIGNAGWYNSSSSSGIGHGGWYNYDSHIPLVFMGWKVKPGKTNETHYMTDIAATLAAMLHIQMPNGSIGSPITELTHQ
ncbi:alkaline phosphatase PafA [Pedobacter boryungensis]|uniref:Alkaline phosphatase family protein n=1 Tax=Pedobacter boryungensis TaxID=869962 RepID=A0ABX2DG67_9SPHI|nr:alkaline phosphatase PafA [Pedobacter boryungensis]NQX33065.1 alkaline phosphatase family protein [Pedobacter boryungensis]